MTTAALNACFQINLDVAGKACLIIGGGDEATDKTERLLDAGALVKIVSPTLTSRLSELAGSGELSHLQRLFEPADLEDVFAVLNTVRDGEFAKRVFDLAQNKDLLINSFDQPDYSNFGMVALVHPGHLRIGISTSNASPSLAGRLRRDLELIFDSEFVEYLDQLGRVRQHLKRVQPNASTRVHTLRSLVTDFHLKGELTYPVDWRDRMAQLLKSAK